MTDNLNDTDADKRSKTLGSHVLELRIQGHDPHATAIDIQRQLQEKYEPALRYVADESRKVCPDKDFFIEVMTKRERIMEEVFRCYFIARRSCATPFFDQSVYRVHARDEGISLLWTIPDINAFYFIMGNLLTIPPEEKWLASCVMAYSDGELYEYCRYLSKEIDRKPNISVEPKRLQ